MSEHLKEKMKMKLKNMIGTLTAKFAALLVAFTCAGSAWGETVAWIGGVGYDTLKEAIEAAGPSDVITLGVGTYTTYGTTYAKNKTLTFVGQGADKTIWGYGSTIPYDGEHGSDYSLEGATVTFKNLRLHDHYSQSADFRGIVRVASLTFENCLIDSRSHYQGVGLAAYKDCVFANTGTYNIDTYSAMTYVFDGCTFYSSKGKFINVYKEAGASRTSVYVNNCTFTVAADASAVVGTSSDAKYACLYLKTENPWTVYFTGDNAANGVQPGTATGDALFNDNKNGTSTVVYSGGTFAYDADGKPVVTGAKAIWENGTAVAVTTVEIDNAKTVENQDGSATYTYKPVTQTGSTTVEGQEATVTVSVAANDDAADTTLAKFDMAEVLAAAVEKTGDDAADMTKVELRVKSTPTENANAISYEVHPEAIITVSKTGEEPSTSTVELSNANLAANAAFTFELNVASLNLSEGDKVKVTHSWAAYTDAAGASVAAGSETTLAAVQANNKVSITTSHFSTWTLEGITIDQGTVAVVFAADGTPTQYTTLAAALTAAYDLSGDVTVQLIANTTGYAAICQKAGQNLTVNGGGNTLTGQLIVFGLSSYGDSTRTETLTIKNFNFTGASDKSNFYSDTDAFVYFTDSRHSALVPASYTGSDYTYAHNVTISSCSFCTTGSDDPTTVTVPAVKSLSRGLDNIKLMDLNASYVHSIQFFCVKDVEITGVTLANTKNGININFENDAGRAVISNSVIRPVAADAYGVRLQGAGNGTVTLQEGTVIAAYEALTAGNTSSTTISSDGAFNVEGGSYKGLFTVSKGNYEFVVTGGIFDNDPSAYVAEGYKATALAQSSAEYAAGYRYTIGECTYVAQVVTNNGATTNKYEDLHAALEAGKAAGSVVTLLADVDLNNEPWTPISGFEGTFDGGNHTISNLYINLPTTVNVGLFDNGVSVFKDLKIVNAHITGSRCVGVLVGRTGSGNFVAQNISVLGEIQVTGTQDAGYYYMINLGGICGGYGYGKFIDCAVIGDADTDNYIDGSKGERYVAGICGHADSVQEYTRCTVKNVKIIGDWLCGGIAGPGPANTITKDCVVEDVEINADYSGGLFGWFYTPSTQSDESKGVVDGCTVSHVSFTSSDSKNGAIGGYGMNNDVVVKNITIEDVHNKTDDSKLISYNVTIERNADGTTDVYYYSTPQSAVDNLQSDDEVITVLNYTEGMVAPDGWDFRTENDVTTLVKVVAQIGETKYPTLAEAVEAVPENGAEATTIQMIANEELSATVTIPAEKNVVLDLNGKTVSGSATVLNVAGTLVIDGTTSGSGISSTGDETIVVNGGTLTVDGGSYMTTGTNKYVFRAKDAATVTIDGCTTECAEGSNLKGFLRADGDSEVVINDATVNIGCQYYVLDSRGGSTITVKGGTFVKHDGREYQQFADMKQGNIAIEGGSFTFNYTGDGLNGGAPELFLFNTADADDGYTEGGKSVLTISGGTFTGLWNNASLEKVDAVIEKAIAFKNTEQACEVYVSGGTYNYNPENWVGWETGAGTASAYPFNAEGYGVVDNDNGTWTVVSLFEAQIVRGGVVVQKGTLAEMIAAATSGDTIQLLKDVEIASKVQLNKEGSYTIDGNGFAIKMAEGATFDGNGILIFGPAGVDANYDLAANIAAKQYTLKNATITGFNAEIIRCEGCSLTLEGCTFTGNNITEDLGRGTHMLRLSQSAVTMTGCTASGNTASQVAYYEGDSGSPAPLVVADCLFSGNTLNGSSVILIADSASEGTTVQDCTFADNAIGSSGNVAVVYCSGPAEVSGNLFSGNSVATSAADKREGVIVLGSDAGGSTIAGNAFVGNTLGTTATDYATVWVNDKYDDYTFDVSGNYWGDGDSADFGSGKDVYQSTEKATVAMTGYATAYTTVAGVNGATVTVKNFVAQIVETGVKYENLMEAIDAAYNGGTVELLADVTVDHWHQNIWTLKDGPATYPEGLVRSPLEGCNGLTINGNGHSLTINSIDSGTNGNQIFRGSRNLTVSNLTINAASGVNGIGLKSGLISDVTFNMAGSNPAIYTSGSAGCEEGEHIEIRNCTFNTEAADSYAIYSCDPGNGVDVGTVISGNTFNTRRSVALRSDMRFLNNTVNGAKGVTVAGGSTAVVSGNYFSATTTSRSINVYPSNATIENNVILGPIELENETYETAPDLSGNYWGGDVPANLPEGVVVNSYYTTYSDHDTPAQDGSLFTLSNPVVFVAQIERNGEVTKYTSAQEALDLVQSGDTLTLYAGDHGTLYIRQSKTNSLVVDVTHQDGEYGPNDLYRALANVTIKGQEGARVNQIIFEAGYYPVGASSWGADWDRIIDSLMEIDNLKIEGVTFGLDKNTAAIKLGDNIRVTGLTVKDCTVNGTGNYGGSERLLYNTLTSKKYESENRASVYDKIQKYDVNFTSGLKNLTITGCTFNNLHQVAELRNLENLTFSGNTVKGNKHQTLLITTNTGDSVSVSGTVTIANNNIDGTTNDRVFRLSSVNAEVSITGNNITGYAHNEADLIKISGSGDDAEYTIAGNTWSGTTSGLHVISDKDTTSDSDLVAKIGSNYYVSLADAIAAVANGQTIVVIADISENGWVAINRPGVAFTIDTNGKTIERTNGSLFDIYSAVTFTNSVADVGAIKAHGRALYCNEGADCTIESGSVIIGTEGNVINVIGDYGSAKTLSKLTMNGGTVAGADAVNLQGNKYGAEFVMNGGIINSEDCGIETHGRKDNALGGVKVTINDGTINAKGEGGINVNGTYDGTVVVVNGGTITCEDNGKGKGAAGIYQSHAYVTINGGVITGSEAIVVKGGTLDVYDGVFTATGAANDPVTPGSSGYAAGGTGDALYIEDNYGHSDYAFVHTVSVNVHGGTFISQNANAVSARFADSSADVAPAEVAIEGGAFKCAAGKSVIYTSESFEGTIATTGGIFSAAPAADYVADGYAVVANTDAATKDAYPYTVGTPVAQNVNTEVMYGTLQDALSEAQNGNTVKLLSDVTIEQTVTVQDKSVVIDGTGHQIIATGGNAANKVYYALYFIAEVEGVSVEIKNMSIEASGYQVVTMFNCDYTTPVKIDNVTMKSDGECIYANGLSVVDVTNSTLTHEGAYTAGKADVYYSAVMVGYGGTVNLRGTRVYSTDYGVATFPTGSTINIYDAEVTAENVSGKTTVTDPSAIYVWVGDEYTHEMAKNSAVAVHDGAKISGAFKFKHQNNSGVKTAIATIYGGVFSADIAALSAEATADCGLVIAPGYIVVANTVAATKANYPYTVIGDIVYPVDSETAGVPVPVAWIQDNTELIGAAIDVDAVITGLAQNGANGVPLWQSYVLGLNPKAATSKLAVGASALVATATGYEVTVKGLNVNIPSTLDSGTKVAFRLEEATPAGAAEGVWTARSEPVAVVEGQPQATVKVDAVAGKLLRIVADIVTVAK